MKNVISASQTKTYLSELWEDEEGLRTAAQAYQDAKSRYEMRLLRYQALRDFIEGQPDAWASRGEFRFTGMKLGDAISQILLEANGPLSMEQIIEHLSAGGAGQDEPVQPRAVAASLTHTRGIRKFVDGRYEGMYIVRDPDKEHEERAWKGEDIDVDDLPFE